MKYPGWFRTLAYIHCMQEKKCHLENLYRATGISRSQTRKDVLDLIEKGWVHKYSKKSNTLYSLTEQGKEKAKQILPFVIEEQMTKQRGKDILVPLDCQHKEKIIEEAAYLLDRFLSAHHIADNHITSFVLCLLFLSMNGLALKKSFCRYQYSQLAAFANHRPHDPDNIQDIKEWIKRGLEF